MVANVKEKLEKLWFKFERYAIYVALLVFILSELVSFFLPTVHSFLEGGGVLILFAAAMLAMIRFIDERLSDAKKELDENLSKIFKKFDEILPKKGNNSIFITDSFSDSVKKTINQKKVFDTMDIFAHSSKQYCQQISDNNIEIKNLRLLVCNPDMIKSFPSSEGKNEEAEEIKNNIHRWLHLCNNGNIKKIEIHEYYFIASYHFMIIDGQSAQFGFLILRSKFPIIDTLNTFVINKETPEGSLLIKDFTKFFEAIFKDMSHPIKESDYL